MLSSKKRSTNAGEPLCESFRAEFSPHKMANEAGIWKWIVNFQDYRQVVEVIKCHDEVEDQSCKYGGRDGRCPETTACKQLYSKHRFLIADSNGLSYDTFLIPTACSCTILHRWWDTQNTPCKHP